jgi:putative acetyltransferase
MVASFQVRPANEADAAAIWEVHEAAFGQPLEARLVAALSAGGHERVSLVAEQDGQIVGHVLCSELHLNSAEQTPGASAVRTLGLAPLAVLPDHQRQGIGSRLVTKSLQEAQRAGWRLVFVLGEPDYYTRFGFSPVLAQQFTCTYACPAFMAIALHPDAAVEGTITYPPPFADL